MFIPTYLLTILYYNTAYGGKYETEAVLKQLPLLYDPRSDTS